LAPVPLLPPPVPIQILPDALINQIAAGPTASLCDRRSLTRAAGRPGWLAPDVLGEARTAERRTPSPAYI